ncbi:fatty acyl-AMP ligase [Nostoc flagelliforme FACHB-838]|uniref:Fatty acyl-AMP ligase n=1 Tax=Nostoc flagelliforme FACHB-838 TaxID=2692904 RepID=A0ABR8E043_9NOSO|nr:fatty acyl-AMP ligase [Nostoc flagelliforme]MBD2534575.1 fatty acyl-AMP ligase [Nostoc flagelliforme FACHB-838]
MTDYVSDLGDSLSNASTLVDLLRYRAIYQPNQTAYTFLVDGETEEVSINYHELEQRSRGIAAYLQSLNAKGERALLLYQPGLEYIAAFFGCLYAEVVAVPAYPPLFNKPMPRLQAIVADAQAKLALTNTSILTNVEEQFPHTPDLAALHWIATDTITDDVIEKWQQPLINSNTLAFLQYTSGSTGTPKGVMVSHGNLLHNLSLIYHCFEHQPHSQGVIWLPPYHDMGLIGGVLQPLYGGFPVILMSPITFLKKPFRWLQAISRYKATTSGGPNFAYDLCVQKIKPEEIATLDLSRWEVAFNGAEPVRAEILERFATVFEPCGFRQEAFYPCYGMAETTLFISGGLKISPPIVRQVKGRALEQNLIVASADRQEGVRVIVGCGQKWLDQKIVIVDPESLIPCPFDQVGEIWVSGPSVAQGYWKRLEETSYAFRNYLADSDEGPFLRTGDLGFLQDGELFVTGRLKDLIIIRGRNHYPQDIELTVEKSHPALRPGCNAAFTVDIKGEERLVVVQEVKRNYLQKLNLDKVIGDIRQALTAQHGLQVYAAVLVKTGSVSKTSSGKIQRYACRAKFLDGTLDVLGKSGRNSEVQRKSDVTSISAVKN